LAEAVGEADPQGMQRRLYANLTQRTDAKGAVTSYSYDAEDQLVRTAYATARASGAATTRLGKLTQVSDASGTSAFSDYSRDRPVREALPGAVGSGADAHPRRGRQSHGAGRPGGWHHPVQLRRGQLD
jgi:YD repeat-containing protein